MIAALSLFIHTLIRSGKTTLLNHILQTPHGLRLAVLENEIGEVAVDDELLADESRALTDGPEVILMPNGCLCCRTRGDLSDALKRLVQRQASANGGGTAQPLDGIILELSGAAEVYIYWYLL
jgi:G3E family GTPase